MLRFQKIHPFLVVTKRNVDQVRKKINNFSFLQSSLRYMLLRFSKSCKDIVRAFRSELSTAMSSKITDVEWLSWHCVNGGEAGIV